VSLVQRIQQTGASWWRQPHAKVIAAVEPFKLVVYRHCPGRAVPPDAIISQRPIESRCPRTRQCKAQPFGIGDLAERLETFLEGRLNGLTPHHTPAVISRDLCRVLPARYGGALKKPEISSLWRCDSQNGPGLA
jgi:hypothetical protein